MRKYPAISILFYVSIFFIVSSAYGADNPVDPCVEIQKKAQQGTLSDDEKVILRNCVLNIPDIGPNNELRKALSNAKKDLIKGPGPNNDLVGKEGWIRKRLGF